MHWSKKRALLSVAMVFALVSGLLILRAFAPSASSFYPPCLFHKITGLHCPGCGGTRCLHALMNRRYAEAAHMNALFLVALPFLAWGALRWWWRWVRVLPQESGARMHPWLARGIAFSVVAFAVLRNLPWPPFTYLAPF